MFAVTFDLVVVETNKRHPKGVTQAYNDIAGTLKQFGFERIQGSVYVTKSEDMANLFQAIIALKALEWFAPSVRDIRAFRIEQWSDFTSIIKKDILIT
ncbi:MAG: virulence factor [Patescibacteria group bacterium]